MTHLYQPHEFFPGQELTMVRRDRDGNVTARVPVTVIRPMTTRKGTFQVAIKQIVEGRHFSLTVLPAADQFRCTLEA